MYTRQKRIVRSRGGCAACKSKRLKCDEARPSCSRCERLGIPCPGYQKALKWTPMARESPAPAATEAQDDNDSFDSEFLEQFAAITEADLADAWAVEPVAAAAAAAAQEPPPLGDWLRCILGDAPRATVPGLLQDHSTVLVEYYFKEVCGMMSCYDSQMNPYRTTISNTWSASPSLYYVTQSMAAACLSEVSPRLSSLGHKLQAEAVAQLAREAQAPEMETASMLALVMLGMSLSWHEPGKVGHSEFKTLTQIITHIQSLQKRVFFYNSLVYWQMLLSFVMDIDPVVAEMPAQPARTDEVRLPHPQTGIGVEVQLLLARVGSLVRKERKRIRSLRFATRVDISEATRSITEAEALHARLCEVQMPAETAVVNSGDDLTPTDHLLKIAEAYRNVGLLQLYRNFPDLLAPYMSDPQHGRAWLTRLALHIIDLVKDIPLSSRSRSIQPLLLVSICSELSLGRDVPLARAPLHSLSASPWLTAPISELDVLCARRFVVSRLSEFQNVLAAKPIRQMLLLVKETWARMDCEQDVYWMDVMIERGYETLMG